MLRKKFYPCLRILALLAFAAVAALGTGARPAAAQAALNAPITPLSGSSVNGDMTLTADAQGNALITVRLSGLTPRSQADVNVHTGVCSQIGTGLFRLFTLTADDWGQATGNAPVYASPGVPMRLVDLADGNHLLLVMAGGVPVACGAVPPVGANSLEAALLAEGERQQVMQFNPNAALQKRIFADGFVPNSAEFAVVVEATTFAAQRAEHLKTGAVRAYFARVGDWGNVVYAQRGVSKDPLGLFMLAEADRRQVIQFNPNAALQKRIFADGFVPNSPEFAMPYAGINYTAQRAEHLGTGRVRVYYAVTGQWGDVRFAQRGSPAPTPPPATTPTVIFSPAAGPSGTVVRVSGAGFASFVNATLWGAPVGSQGIPLATGMTDSAGRINFEVPVQGAAGMRYVFSIIAGSQRAQSGEFLFTR